MSGLNLAPQTQPIRDKRKTNWVFLISIFPRLAWIYSSLWLAAYIVCVVCCDWLADLTSILHPQRAFLEKTQANRERTNTISKAATDNFNKSSNIFVIFSWARLATCTCGHFLCINCRDKEIYDMTTTARNSTFRSWWDLQKSLFQHLHRESLVPRILRALFLERKKGQENARLLSLIHIWRWRRS